MTVSGEGRLEAKGMDGQAGIGLSRGADGSSAALTVTSGEIVATGGATAAGIGGANGQDGFAVYVYGGTVTATGGDYGAGIGGGNSAGAVGGMVVTNGVVSATGGSKGAGIGGGWRGRAGAYRQFGGTVVARGVDYGADIGQGREGYSDPSCYTTIYGGSLNSASDRITKQPQNLTGNSVYCVTIQTSRPNFDVGAVMADYDGYLLTGVKTDDEGKIYIWLPDGTYYFTLGGVPYRAVVDGADTEAETWAVGVTVNGEDVALRFGEGWTYDVESHALSVTNDGCVVSGTNTAGEVFIDCSSDVAVTVSNLVLTTSSINASPIQIASNVAVVVTLAGENALTSSWSGSPAIHVPYSATLTVTNIDSYVVVPDLDNINYYTNTIESIEEEDDGHGGVVVVTNYVDIVTVVTNYENVLTAPVLTAKGAYEAAAIGGGYLESCGTIEIVGGDIRATGGTGGAGIGSGSFSEELAKNEIAEQGTVRISGGKVTATGGRYAAGIGGGNWNTGGTISVSGGEVEAYGDQYGAGIGGGYRAHGYRVTITGGKVKATGGERGAGIGNGYSNQLRDRDTVRVSISGGQITAVGGEAASGIGGGFWEPQCAVVNITGGTVVATGGNEVSGYIPDDIGYGGYSIYENQFAPLTIKGASVHATHRTASNEYVSPAPSNGTERVWCVTVETSKTNELVRVDYLNGFGEGSDIYADADGKIYLWLPNGSYVFYVADLPVTATVNGADTVATPWLTGVTVDGVDVSFRRAKKWGYDYESKTLGIIGDCVVSGRNTAGLVNILAVPEGELSFTISNLYLKATEDAKAPPFAVTNGTVTIRLAGANTFDATETDDYAGLNVVSPATLVITNLEETASLTAYSGEDAAAIGGNQRKNSSVNYTTGTIRINGGMIYARAKDSGAGIGSGYKGRSGDIYISGGQIEAYGGEYSTAFSTCCGAGIGGGDSAFVDSGRNKIVFSGGTVIARGGYRNSAKYAADIGTGYEGSGVYSVEISGGSVHPGADNEDQNFNQSERGNIYPVNSAGSQVFKMTHEGFAPYAKVDLVMDGYGSNDIYADAAGKVYVWLANGVHYYSIDGQRYATKMEDGTATTVRVPDAYGVEVDGVDVVNFSGDKWSYDVFSCQLSVTNACVISGTNTDGQVNISVDATEAFALTISNLYLKATGGSPITVLHGTNTLCLVGTNVLDAADAAGHPGLHVATLYEGVVITNLHDGAMLVAKGGENAAGIGGDNSENAGKIAIAGGIIEATGGSYGAGIGGGRKYGFAEISITAGTVTPVGGTGAKAIGYGSANESYIGSEKIVFTGGSIATSAENVGAQGTTKAVNADGDMVYPVAISGFTPYARADMEIEGYNACGVYADGEGKIYPWLVEGDYIFILDGVPHLAHVTSSGAVAEPWLSGVTANGTDLAYLHDENGQWAYNFSKRTLYILTGTSPADCVTVSGTNTADYVYVVATNEVYFAISNLNLKTTSAAPIALACANATVAFAGTNTLDASGASQYAALQTRTAQSAWTGLVLTNLDEGATLVAKGGSGGAGVGCGSMSSSSYCKVYVYGGNITAEGGLNGSGIGGGANGSSEVYVYGGRVTAAGGSYAAGIGGGKNGQGRVDIHGGTVDATATAGGGAGIGGGASGDGTVSVIDGAVTACGNGLGAGIGGGSGGKGYVYVSGGSIKPIAGTYAASKSVGNGNTTGGEVLFTGGSIHTTVAYVNPAASNANHVAVWPVTVTGLKAGSEITFDGLPSSYGTNGICTDEDGKVRLWLPNGDYAFTATDDDGIARLYVAPVADAPADATYSAMTGFTVNGCDVAYLSGEGWSYSLGAVNGGITLSGLDHYELSGALTNKYLIIGNSCSIVFSNVVFNSFNVDTQHGVVNIAGSYDVDLTIEGENSVKAPSGGYLAGIRVPTGATLTIDGGGSLESTAGPYAAGIGGGRNSGCGTITINGGTVTATGGNYAAGIGGGGPDAVFAGTITITGGVVTATGGSYAAGIGGGAESDGGSVKITGGRVTATSGSGGGACIGAGKNGTYGDVVISGGTVVASTDEYRTHAIGDGFGTDGFGKVTITGGSVHAAYAGVTPAPSNGTAAVSCVIVSNLAANAAVAFDGLPTYYGTSGIYADAAGKVYLWLPEGDWEGVTPHLLGASLHASSGTSHAFAANGYRYTVTIPAGGGEAVATQGAPLELEGFRINDFAIEDGMLTINVSVKPDTWLYGFFDRVAIHSSESLPIQMTPATRLDTSAASVTLEDDGSATYTLVLPPAEGSSRFFTIGSR